MLDAFRLGDPETAYLATERLVHAYRDLLVEVAQMRFTQNFGTERCHSCDGLHAGPDVTATCFQMKQCHYDNLKVEGAAPRHLRVLTFFEEAPKKS